MEGSSRNRELYSQFLDMIPNEREWLARRDEARFGVSEDKKLELRLGPPGEDWFDKENREKDGRERDESLLSLGSFSSPASSKSNNSHNNSISAGAKRVFLDTVEAKAGEQTWLMNHNQNQKLSFSEKPSGNGTILSSPWCSSTSPSPSHFQVKTQQQQQQPKPQFLQVSSVPQSLPVIPKGPSQTCNDTKLAELQNPEKKSCSTASGSVPANTIVLNSSHKRTSPAPVVGWPPVRAFRKNLASGSSSSKPASEIRDTPPAETHSEKTEACRKGLFVKINMDGVPIGRKVDLKAYDSYEKLSLAVDELFRGLLAAQEDSSAAGDQNKKAADTKAITGLLDGKGEFTLVYEDNEGDRMLVGDVPWHMFVSTVKRLRVLKSSELPTLQLGSSKPGKSTRVDCGVKGGSG
ncbi:auxin-responsive protein IAA26-like [Macadamia integrifolia]|uniref:auxin-responsive protein IAA26-like n=1 Tax=Macadamia integrifolia TaxID=60698 RepID=UPI001C4FD24A|nr:auxin-responsive protein IAA26-like [Macadamia integrifolia]